jgi:hypothetical protein
MFVHVRVLVFIEVVASVVFKEHHVNGACGEHTKCQTKNGELHCLEFYQEMPLSRSLRRKRKSGLT